MERNKSHDNKLNGWYTISPVEAAMLLENRNRNRPLTEASAVRMAEAIKAGKFAPNGESIVFDADGKLLDGQHRLRACVLANKPIDAMCVYLNQRTSASLFDSIDQGRSRSAADRLALDGVQYATAAAGVARLQYLYEAGVTPASGHGVSHSVRPTIEALRRTYAKIADELQYAISQTAPHLKSMRGWLPTTVAAWAYMNARRVNPEKADKWLFGLITGENLPTGSPILAVRRALQAREGSRQLSRSSISAFIVKSWIYFNGEQTVQTIYWRDGEDFPKFTDAPPEATIRARQRRAAVAIK